MKRKMVISAFLLAIIFYQGCSGSDDDNEQNKSTDTGTGNGKDAGSEDTGKEDAGGEPVPETPPFLEGLTPDDSIQADGVNGKVYIVKDTYGIPHIYSPNEYDLAFATGYMHASDRYFQMELMRRVAEGTLSELTDASNLSTDNYLRMWQLGKVGKEYCDSLEEGSPEKTMLEGYTAGVNAYVQNVKRATDLAIELVVLGISKGSDVKPWTCADSMSIARLQTWDLSMPYVDIDYYYAEMQLTQTFPKGDAREGIEKDLAVLKPVKPTTILEKAPTTTSARVTAKTGGKKLLTKKDAFTAQRAMYERAAYVVQRTRAIKEKYFGITDGHGSNNWIISPEKAKNGYSLLANDTHLSLSNPPIFYLIHINNSWANGDLDVGGFSFPGIPGVVIGQTENAAWGATVHASDVVDYYIEEITLGSDGYPKTALLDGKQVNIERQKETFQYKFEGVEKCEDLAEQYMDSDIKATNPYSVKTEGDHCILEIDYLVVPHHGPIISVSQDGKSALSFKWTGFEVTNELRAFLKVGKAKTTDEFFEAFDYFGVGAQNIVFANTDGEIAYYAHNNIPIRKTYSEEYPPWNPMPGTGEYEWIGNVPNDQLAQSRQPEKGYLITANNDPIGNTIDGDPLNEVISGKQPYLGSTYDCGYRANRITTKIEEVLGSSEKLSLEDMQAIQGNVTSNVADDFLPLFLEVLTAAKNGENPKTAALYDSARMDKALTYLNDWTLTATSGVGDDQSETDINDSIATSIFNAWFGWFSVLTVGDEVRKANTSISGEVLIRGLKRITLEEDELVAKKNADGHSVIFDNLETPEEESRDEIIMTALVNTLTFLETDGFGTTDMTEWRWGKLHTLTLEHLGGAEQFNIPRNDKENPNGFPRHGDNFAVDASNYGIDDTKFNSDFTYDSGPAMRFTCEMVPDKVHCELALPGGQKSKLGNEHWDDLMRNYWVKNKYFKLPFYNDEVLDKKETLLLLDK